jgi:hypothetical protein
MDQRKGPSPPPSRRESVAEQTSKTAMALVEADARRTRAKTERLRALRLAREAAEAKK